MCAAVPEGQSHGDQQTALETRELIRRTIAAARDGDGSTFVELAEEVQSVGWDHSNPTIISALTRALSELPEVSPNSAAALSASVAERFTGSIAVARTVMEAVIRGAAGESGPADEVPPNITGIYALLVLGQLVHEERLTIDDVLTPSGG